MNKYILECCFDSAESAINATNGVVIDVLDKEGNLDIPMKYGKSDVSMGLPSLSEYEIWQTSEENVRAAVEVLKSTKK